MLKKIASSLLCLPLVAGIAFAQGPNNATTMVCKTTDGTIRISDHLVTLANYRLQFDSIVQNGVMRFVDPGSNAVAMLDARDDDGLYLIVSEGGQTMQVVAARANISYENGDRGNEPASPSLSSVLNVAGTAPQSK
ncbi:MAG: hypothetical protein WC824_00580 [Bacteroidota bacterium]|jgi:hypothetical protein